MNKEILKRFFDGRSNTWEKKQVQEYFEGDELEVFDEYVKEQEGANHQINIDEEYKRNFYAELNSKISEQQTPASQRKNLRVPSLLKFAAGIAIICSVSSLFYIKRQKQVSTEMASRLTRIINSGRNLKMVELADGTKIWMNPGSVITYDKQIFADSARQISLSGEAYFNVTHNANRPFQVTAGQLTTTVLGTSFNVEAYENESETRVMLVTGSVKVNAGEAEEMLRPGQQLDFSKEKKVVKISSVDVSDKQKELTNGKLVFENLALEEVLKRLERVFDLKITVTDRNILKDKRITGTYYREDAELVLKRILFIHGLTHHKKGENKYVIE